MTAQPPRILPAGLRAALITVPAICAVVVVAAARQSWRKAGSVAMTGTEATGGLIDGLGLLGLASCALLLVMGPVGRRVVGVLLAGVGVGTVLAVLLGSDVSAATWAAHGVATGTGLDTPLRAPGWVGLAAGAVMALAGAGLAVAARRWPARTSRFARSRDARPVAADADPREVWAAFDRGEDPTAVENPGTGPLAEGEQNDDRRD